MYCAVPCNCLQNLNCIEQPLNRKRIVTCVGMNCQLLAYNIKVNGVSHLVTSALCCTIAAVKPTMAHAKHLGIASLVRKSHSYSEIHHFLSRAQVRIFLNVFWTRKSPNFLRFASFAMHLPVVHKFSPCAYLALVNRSASLEPCGCTPL